MRRATHAALMLGALALAATPGLAADRFEDVPADHLFSAEIAWLADEGVTRGCNPPENTRFCPDEAVTRGQMAAFLVRALGLTAEGPTFEDTEGHTFEGDISRLAEAGITRGCNPPENTRFCPDEAVTRGQMAAFLVRALGLTAEGPTFEDTEGHTFEGDISRLAEAGITRGCNPPENTRFCPDEAVTRGQMAAFLFRAFATEGPALGDVVGISAGTFHSCAVTEEGAAYCWGGNEYGELGNGTTEPSDVPVRVRDPDDNSGFLTGVTQISAGQHHTCAVTSGGRAYCWGFNLFGRLGDGTLEDRSMAVPVRNAADSGLLTEVSQIDAGTGHTCAVTEDGAAYCWGGGHEGALGDGTTGDLHWRELPARVRNTDDTGTLTGVTQISAGHSFTCGVLESGAAYCWGNNDFAQLGDGTEEMRALPVQVRSPGGDGELTQVEVVSAGGDHSCAATGGGAAYCWGNNFRGSLGDGTTVDSALPVRVRNPSDDGDLSGVAQVATGTAHSCALSGSGAAYCWGNNFAGRLGDGTTEDSSLPVRARNVFNTGDLAPAVDIGGGSQHTCAATAGGTAYCWGDNEEGQLGDGTTEDSSLPVPVRPPG
ncbi:MAG: S-layer homology domain-containing protein [Actinomycetota bacterium]